MADNVNLMAANCTNQTRSIAEVAKAITAGDLTKKIDVDAQGEFLELKIIVNHMTERLNLYVTEATRVARDVGSRGMMGQFSSTTDVGGAWKGLVECVDRFADNVTNLVRSVAHVTVSDSP